MARRTYFTYKNIPREILKTGPVTTHRRGHPPLSVKTKNSINI